MDQPLATAQHHHVADAYDQHHRHVLRICTAILRDADEAQDAAHEVFGRLLRQPPGGVRDMRRWLGEVARNHCLDRLRQRERRPVLPLSASTEATQQGSPESVAVDRGYVAAVLAQLEPRQRSALVRSAVLDHPLERIAADMGISYGAAGQLLWRARHQALRIAHAPAAILSGLAGTRALQRLRQQLRVRPRRAVTGQGLREALGLTAGAPAIIAVALLMSPGLSGVPGAATHAPSGGSRAAGGSPAVAVAADGARAAAGARSAAALGEAREPHPAGTGLASTPSPPPQGTKRLPGPSPVPTVAPVWISFSGPEVSLSGVPVPLPHF
jgi:RNA polymerase sigma-70 factor (ECF subfamily)